MKAPNKKVCLVCFRIIGLGAKCVCGAEKGYKKVYEKKGDKYGKTSSS